MSATGTPESDGFDRSLAPLEWGEVRRMVRQRTATLLGARAADHMLPTADAAWIEEERGLTVESGRLLAEGQRLPFESLRDPVPILDRLRVEGVRLGAQEVYDVCLVLRTTRDIAETLEKAEVAGMELPLLASRAAALPDPTPILRTVADHVTAAGVVQDSASAELKRIRRRIRHLSEKLQRELQSIIDRTDSDVFLRDEFITVRNGRYVLPIRTDSPFPVKGILHGRSSTGLTHFVEPMVTVEINNEIVSLREAEEEEVDRLLRHYTRLLRDALPAVEEAVAAVGRFDLIQARARLAADLRCVTAEEPADDALRLTEARHPILVEALAARGEQPVPISIGLGGDYPVLIVSGPNTGGKTVSLKTIGLLVLMNQAGLLIPAAEARLPIFRRVLVDIGDHQSIAANLSTFSSHMQNIGWMARQVEPPALVLLDEIGTGTDPEEGAALGAAILAHFHRLGALAVVTTHMSGIKQYGYSTPGVQNAAVEFDESTLQPTYRVLMGVAGSSSGIDIARRLGLPDEIVADARERRGPAGEEADAYLRRIKETMHEVARERERLAGELREAERRRARQEADAERREAERARWFRDELAGAVERYEKALREHLRRVDDKALRRKLEKEGLRRGGDVAATIEREARERFARPPGPAPAPPETVGPGDRVQIPALGQKGTVEGVDGDKVRIDVGGKRLSVRLAELTLLEPAASAARGTTLPKGVHLTAPDKNVGTELQLIGRTVDEALPEVDKFLDDAFLAGLPSVRLIHGHGRGTLRKAIAEFLKDHPHVANYRLAADREGGTAVTVVELRR